MKYLNGEHFVISERYKAALPVSRRFPLTTPSGLLMDLVEAAEGRVVTLSGIAHLSGEIRFDDLMGENAYSPTSAYTQSKGANLMFALELDRRLQAAGKKAVSIACHPGYTNTSLQSTGPTGFFSFPYKITNPFFAQSGPEGALPTVLAAAGAEANGADIMARKSWEKPAVPLETPKWQLMFWTKQQPRDFGT